jgi:hypothetical protein
LEIFDHLILKQILITSEREIFHSHQKSFPTKFDVYDITFLFVMRAFEGKKMKLQDDFIEIFNKKLVFHGN